MSPGGDLSRLRQLNERAVLDIVRTRGSARLTEIASLAGLTRASVAAVVRTLESLGWIAVESPVADGRGRPAYRYRFRAEAGYVAGIDIGAHSVHAAVGDLAGSVLAEYRLAVRPSTPRAARLRAAGRAVRTCLERAGVAASEVWVTAAGSTGTIESGVVRASVAIPDWAGLDLASALAPHVPGRVLAENDVRLSALAELRLGAARGVDDVLVLQAGVRTGLVFVVDGRLHVGAHQVSGDVSRLGRLNAEALFTPPTLENGPEVARYVRALGRLVSVACAMVDPAVVVLSGTAARHADVMQPLLARELERRCLRPPEVMASTFADRAVAVGALCHALDHLGGLLLTADPVPPLERPA